MTLRDLSRNFKYHSSFALDELSAQDEDIGKMAISYESHSHTFKKKVEMVNIRPELYQIVLEVGNLVIIVTLYPFVIITDHKPNSDLCKISV